MPELPEVEIVARSLDAQVRGRVISAIEKLDWERMVETPDLSTLYDLLPGRQIQSAGRRAKWALITLDAGWTLAIHLRMSGNLVVQAADVEPDVYTHLVLALDDGRRIFFHDQRKFGRVRLLDPAGLQALDQSLGPEPLGSAFTPEVLSLRLAGRRTKIKPLLLDQAVIAGLGNIYANEALWIAGIHPLRPAASLSNHDSERLHAAIRATLTQAIIHEGSTLRNYRNGYGQRGSHQEHFFVYDRAGRACTRCGTLIERIVTAQRSTFFCPACQPETSGEQTEPVEDEHAASSEQLQARTRGS